MKIGLAEVDYSPDVGLPLAGNYRDDYASRGVHDPLRARGYVFRDEAGNKAALMTMDVCMLDRNNVALIRDCVAAHTDIAPENLLVAATHTHSGPMTRVFARTGELDQDKVTALLQRAAAAVVEADADLQDATMSIGQTEERRVSFIRRLRCTDGTTHMNWEGLDPEQVVEALGQPDYQLQAVRVATDDRTRGVIVNFGLHPAVLAGDNWLYSADYPGYLVETLKRLVGPGVVAGFFNGPCGNVNHIDYTDPTQGRGYQMCQRIGTMLGVATLEAMKETTAVADGPVRSVSRKVALQRQQFSDEQLDWACKVLKEAELNPAAGQVDGLPDEHYARLWLTMAEQQDQPDEVEVQVLRLGELAVVGLPGEIFCEYGKQIKAESVAPHTLVIELAGDSIGYLPTREAFDQGGYEPTVGSTRYQPGSADKLAGAALETIRDLFAQED